MLKGIAQWMLRLEKNALDGGIIFGEKREREARLVVIDEPEGFVPDRHRTFSFPLVRTFIQERRAVGR